MAVLFSHSFIKFSVFYSLLNLLEALFLKGKEFVAFFDSTNVFDIWVHRIHIETTSCHDQHVQITGQRGSAPIAEQWDMN